MAADLKRNVNKRDGRRNYIDGLVKRSNELCENFVWEDVKLRDELAGNICVLREKLQKIVELDEIIEDLVDEKDLGKEINS